MLVVVIIAKTKQPSGEFDMRMMAHQRRCGLPCPQYQYE